MIDPRLRPDILDCLANLSSDEVFTPPKLASEMLDLLPKSLWSNPNARFIDPFTKSGVFLREIVKRLDAGLEKQMPDRDKRIRHILGHQVYGIAITHLTAHFSRRTLYCNKEATSGLATMQHLFRTSEGLIRYKPCFHKWVGESCSICGASKKAWGTGRSTDVENYAYPFLHDEEIQKMATDLGFDVVIGNPPYQMKDGGSAGGAIPIYQKFVEQAEKLNPRYIVMIIPSRWFAGGRGLDDFRKNMLSKKSLKRMVDYPKSRDCFQGVDIAGGVCYFLIDKKYSGPCEFTSIRDGNVSTMIRDFDEYPIFVRDNIGVGIVRKVVAKTKVFMDSIVQPVSPFGLRSFARGASAPFEDAITLVSSAGRSYIKKEDIKKGKQLIGKYKVVVGYLNPDRAGVNNASDKKSNVTTKISILGPNEVITETYIILGAFNTMREARNCESFIRTKFARYLVLLTLSSMHITKLNFQFVPLVDFSKSWTDDELYDIYDIVDKEQIAVESMIRPMEEK